MHLLGVKTTVSEDLFYFHNAVCLVPYINDHDKRMEIPICLESSVSCLFRKDVISL